MTVQKFLEQLVLQLGVGTITVSQRKRKRRRRSRNIICRGRLTPINALVWLLFSDLTSLLRQHFQINELTPLRPEHLKYIRANARAINFNHQREALAQSDRQRYWAAEDAWEIWNEIFEDVVKQLNLVPSPTE